MKNKDIINAYNSIKDEYNTLKNNFHYALSNIGPINPNISSVKIAETDAFKKYNKACEELEKFENSDYKGRIV